MPVITGTGEFTTKGRGSISVHTDISFLLCDEDSSKIPPPFQPKPIRRKVMNIVKFMAEPPAIPAKIVFPCVGCISLIKGVKSLLDSFWLG